MSQLTVAPGRTARPRRAPVARRPAVDRVPELRTTTVTAPAQTRAVGAGFVTFCLLALVGGLVALLLLNTQRAQQSFALDNLQSRTATLSATQESLGAQLDSQAAPQQLALKAQGMGMVPATNVRYVDAKGRTVGVAKGSSKSAALTVGTLPSTPASSVASVASAAVTQGVQVPPAPAPKVTPAPTVKATPAPAAKSPAKPTAKATASPTK